MDVGELVNPIMQSRRTPPAFSIMAQFAQARSESIFPLWLLQHLPNMAAAHISILHHAMGPNNTIVTACAAGTQAVGDAFRLIARGDADVMLAGGCDSRLDPQLLVAYSAMKAVSSSVRPPSEVSRPFDADRDGFVLGEGAAVLVLEGYRRAKRRRRRIYAEVTGYGSSFDAFGITRPEPEGKGAALSMTSALREARVDASEIDYINAHGTSTRLNDLMETVAVKRVFGHRATSIPISSQKSMIGHLIGASGAVEAAATALSLERGVVPPTINLATPDPALRPGLRSQYRPGNPLEQGDFQQLWLRWPECLPRHVARLTWPQPSFTRWLSPSPIHCLPSAICHSTSSFSPFASSRRSTEILRTDFLTAPDWRLKLFW